MKTKYDVDQTVLLKVRVLNIIIDDKGINYAVLIPGKKNAIRVSEVDVAGCMNKEDVHGSEAR